MSEKSAHKLIEHIGTDLDAMEKGDIESCKKYLKFINLIWVRY